MASRSILVINPNSNRTMTDTLRPILDNLHVKDITYTLFTAPSGPTSINNEDDAEESLRHCAPAIDAIAHQHAGFLVGCYSAHPLVPYIRSKRPGKHVLGIFEASVYSALEICRKSATGGTKPTWGIVTTGAAWEPILREAVENLPLDHGEKPAASFAGVRSTGFNADELHDAPKDLVRQKLTEATKKLIEDGKEGGDGRRLSVVLLGCAGMAELRAIVSEVVPKGVTIVDGVESGYLQLAKSILGETA